jgi:hypothetical protein
VKKLIGCLILMTLIPAAFVAAEGKNMMGSKMMSHCKEMMEQKQKMNDEMKAQDAKLTEQIAEMNRAPEDKKMGLMEAILTQMVEQRAAMDVKKSKMQDAMMKHMAEHMQMGKDSMSQCPMMKGMKDMDEKSADTHKEHHEEQK